MIVYETTLTNHYLIFPSVAVYDSTLKNHYLIFPSITVYETTPTNHYKLSSPYIIFKQDLLFYQCHLTSLEQSNFCLCRNAVVFLENHLMKNYDIKTIESIVMKMNFEHNCKWSFWSISTLSETSNIYQEQKMQWVIPLQTRFSRWFQQQDSYPRRQ